ncbi:MAG: sulfur carrier protein ThiS [Candidatus Sabulitectum sp.]|nr:sulfur carrier protein ThiS [Candidatus Sabulitectum sp.]
MIIVNGDKLEWHDGMTIRDILNAKNYKFRMLVTKVNGILVKRADYDTTTVPDEVDVKVIHLISGG